MTKLAVLSNDHVGRAMAGPAIRSYNFAAELARDFDVTLMIPNEAQLRLEGVHVVPVLDRSPGALNRVLAPFDVVVTQLLPTATIRRLAHAGKRVIYDLYNPFLAEPLAFLDAEAPDRAAVLFARSTVVAQRLALATGSAFVCASERQRDLWLGVLSSAGRVSLDEYRRDATLRRLIDVVPFGLPAARPAAAEPVLKGVRPGIGAGDRVLLWAGGIWNWLDPLTIIRAVARIAERRNDVKLLFLGLRHPNPQFAEMTMARRAVELARTLGVLDRFVFFNRGWVPYGERQRYLLEADIGVSAHFDILETRYAFRTRLLDYFWAGLPTVTTRGDVLGELVERRGLGRAVDFEDVNGWASAVERLLDDGAARERISAQLERVRAELAWPRVVEPLARLVSNGSVAGAARTRERILALEERWLRLQTSLALGGPRGLVRRQVAKLVERAR